jgi:hypothetical protein
MVVEGRDVVCWESKHFTCKASTNSSVESFHNNMKRILYSSRERVTRHKMDCLTYHLVGDILTHYWYGVQCKIFGFVRNKKQEGIIANVILRAYDIPNTNVMLHPDGEDIALVASTNHPPKMWIVHVPTSKWPQCNCPIVKQRIICKHVMKIFKMIHLHVLDDVII